MARERRDKPAKKKEEEANRASGWARKRRESDKERGFLREKKRSS
jgi:hypothetical protein